MVTGPVMQNDVEVFEVGKLQLWRWCEWNGHYNLTDKGCPCHADSLAKGRYAVVSVKSTFGRMETKPTVWESFGGLLTALGYIAEVTEAYSGNYCEPLRRYPYSYVEAFEVWHIVDDDELWGDWERDVELSRLAVPVCDDVPEYEVTLDELRDYTNPTSNCPIYLDSELSGFDRLVRSGFLVGHYLVVERENIDGLELNPSVMGICGTSWQAVRSARDKREWDVAAGLDDAGIITRYEIWHVTDTSDGSDPASDYWECVACGYRTGCEPEPEREPEPIPTADFELAISDEQGPLGSIELRDAQAWQLLEYCRSLKEHGYDVRVSELAQ